MSQKVSNNDHAIELNFQIKVPKTWVRKKNHSFLYSKNNKGNKDLFNLVKAHQERWRIVGIKTQGHKRPSLHRSQMLQR